MCVYDLLSYLECIICNCLFETHYGYLYCLFIGLNLPIIDPALYIHRFAIRLEFGDKLNIVVLTALRLITRLKKDWISTGRRPDGICAAAMLIAARAHGFLKGQIEVAKLFRVSADTIKRRLWDFK